MPSVGLGTWQLEGPDFEDAIIEAIRLGYRHIDTAESFKNEPSIGWAISSAIKKNFVTRQDLFITTKISEEIAGYDATRRLVKNQLHFLKSDYIDLYMIQSPFQDKSKFEATWQALEELLDEGKIRSLGVW
jgi:diketogulonate reductase-like aldo/keto reductase